MALGRGSITVAMTSIASSLGKRVSVLRYYGDQSFFFSHIIDDREDLFRHCSNRPHAIHQVVDPKLLVILHQRGCFFFICPESFSYQIFTVIRPMKKAPTANVTDAFHAWSAAERVVDFTATWTDPSSGQSIRQ